MSVKNLDRLVADIQEECLIRPLSELADLRAKKKRVKRAFVAVSSGFAGLSGKLGYFLAFAPAGASEILGAWVDSDLVNS